MTSQELKLFCDVVNAASMIEDIRQMGSCGCERQEDAREEMLTAHTKFVSRGCAKLAISRDLVHNTVSILRERGIYQAKPTQVIKFFHRG